MTSAQYRAHWIAAIDALRSAESRYEEATGSYVTPAALELTAALARVRAVKLEWLTDRYRSAVLDADTAHAVYTADPTPSHAYAYETARGLVREARAALDVIQQMENVAHTIDITA